MFGEPKQMGASSSSESPKQRGITEAVDKAMAKCNSTLQYLNTSSSVLATKRDKARTAAVGAFRRGDKMEAVELLRKAQIAASDLQNIRQQQLAIEQQRSMIEQQQRNTRLTELLVETSAALHSANAASGGGATEHPADIIHQASEQMEAVYDAQAEVAMSHREFGQLGLAAGGPGAAGDQSLNGPSVDLDVEFASELQLLAELSDAEASKAAVSKPPPRPGPGPAEVVVDAPVPPTTTPKLPQPEREARSGAQSPAPAAAAQIII